MSSDNAPLLGFGGLRLEGGVLVIAEAGVNHNGDPKLAHRLIEAAATAGADAVKFQTFLPSKLVAATAAAAPYQQRTGASSQRELLEALTLPNGVWAELARHAADRGLLFLSTPFDVASLDLLLGIGVAALKIPSGEIDNLQFLSQCASRGLHLLVSTGMSTIEEVQTAIETSAAAPGITLLHCVTAYPCPIEASNLRAIPTMIERFSVPVGWSDHTRGNLTAIAAVALGAVVLEKHLTLDRSLPGPDHVASADPAELEKYVAAVRAARASLGDGVKRPLAVEEENRRLVRRSHHAARDLHPGHRVKPEDVVLLRPAEGLPPAFNVVGRTVARLVRAGKPLVAEDLAG